MREVWNRGEVAYGLWTTIADPFLVGLAGRAGFEYTCIDLQHGVATWSELPVLLRFLETSGTTPIVRVQACETSAITRALDLGARGVVVPMVENAEQARTAVAAARYAAMPGRPDSHGQRSYGPIFAALDGAPSPDRVNEEAIVIVMIETPGAYAAIEEIAAVPGVDVLYVGPYDLALSSGFGQAIYRDDPAIETMIQRVVDVAVANGKIPAVHCTDVQMIHDWRERGARMLTSGLDASLVAEAFAARRAQALTGA